MSSNLPPGCSPSDIPGNRPEDIAREDLDERLLRATCNLYNEDLADLVNAIEGMTPAELLDMIQRIRNPQRRAVTT